MLLSKLELNGFKSFPDRVELRFDEGIMGVVGPNGCGKTNILDSIRWVLGEQRSTLLRAGRIEEVIFNGTTQLKGADMAEVSLTIKNNRGVLPLEYDELVVTRRLFRSGESEYLLNKSRCRLKDITNLFADTGMGIHAYSIFQQGMVDAVLSDKAEERRFLFEEAAGITKYKNRKKEALKKLENTESDLVRLNDIITEIAQNVRSLNRQAARARRYKKIKEELQQLDILRASAQLHDLNTTIGNHEGLINDFKIERQTLNSEIDKQEALVEELRLKIAELSEKISSQAAVASDFSEKAIRSENNLTNIQTRLETGWSSVQLWQSEIGGLEGRIQSLREQKALAENGLAEKGAELEKLQTEIIEIEVKVLQAKEALDESAGQLESIKDELHRCENEIGTDKARLEAIDNSIDRMNAVNRDLGQSLSKYEAKKQSSRENLEIQQENLSKCETEIEKADEQIKKKQHEHLQLAAQIEEIKRQISSARAEDSAVKAKIEVLSKMVLEHEGYGSGIKELFAWPDKPEGVIDTLANLVTAEKQYHQAVEAALGIYGELAVCRSYQDALASIKYLGSKAAGRVGFLVLEHLAPSNGELPAIENPNYIGKIADLIDCQEFLKPALVRLFGGLALFKADGIPDGFNFDAVDLDGNYVNRCGVLVGGKLSYTLVGRKSELSDYQELSDTIVAKIETLQNNLESYSGKLSQTNNDAESLRTKKNALLRSRENLISEMTRLEFEFKESVSRLDEIAESSSEAGKQVESLKIEKQRFQDVIARKEQDKQALSGKFQVKFDEHKRLVEIYNNYVEELNRNRLRSVELTGLLHKLEDDARRYVEIIDEAGEMINQKSRMIQDEQNKWHELENERDNIKGQLAKIFEAKDKVDSEKDNLNNEKNTCAETANLAEVGLKQLRSKTNLINDKIHEEELKYSEYENSIKSVKDQIYHEYGVLIEAQKADGFDESANDSGIQRLKNILERIGPVNMLADEEYITEKGRLDFLEKQYADLQEAKSSLREVIHKINKTAEEKFSETFELIKENFQNVFESLFEGGTAGIKLTSPDDVLDSPIEITARPGSKKLVSVNQLSGGERSLTAISLLFAIYMVKPSPFCILDEIDAPLDDANVTRFLKLVNKFTHSTQFIVITHNKKTMEAADLLYGVTMEKPGVSNIVSVKFNGNLAENAKQN